MGLYSLSDKNMMALQNFGEMFPTSHDADQAMNIKAEEVSDPEEEEDPMPITFLEIKAEPEVSSVFLYAHC
jgi:CRISPR/Cas system CMR subunit Cmr6 (Cas7 group RAMP superfamily)